MDFHMLKPDLDHTHIDLHSLTKPENWLVWGGALFVGAVGDHRITLSYAVGIIGVAVFHASKSFILWVERRQTISSLKQQVGDQDKQISRLMAERDSREAQRIQEIQELRSELREQRHAHANELQRLHNIVAVSKREGGFQIITTPEGHKRVKPGGHATSGASILPGGASAIIATPVPGLGDAAKDVPESENSSPDTPPT